MTPLIFIFQLLIAVPVAIVLALTSVWYIWESGNTVLYASFAQKMFSGIENYGLLAIPLFIGCWFGYWLVKRNTWIRYADMRFDEADQIRREAAQKV